MDGHDILMVQPGHGARLAQEALGKGGISRQMFVDDLDGDDSIECPIQGFVNDTHPALRKYFLDDVLAGRLGRSSNISWEKGTGRRDVVA